VSSVLLWARAFLLTVSIESLVATPLLVEGGKPVAPLSRRLAVVGVAQVMSHPAVWFIFPALGLSYTVSLALSEAWAVGSEIVLYRVVFPELAWSRAAAAAALANAASFGTGILVRYLLS